MGSVPKREGVRRRPGPGQRQPWLQPQGAQPGGTPWERQHTPQAWAGAVPLQVSAGAKECEGWGLELHPAAWRVVALRKASQAASCGCRTEAQLGGGSAAVGPMAGATLEAARRAGIQGLLSF